MQPGYEYQERNSSFEPSSRISTSWSDNFGTMSAVISMFPPV